MYKKAKSVTLPVEEVGKDLTNVQKVIRKMQSGLNSGMDPKLLVEYLGAEVKDLAAFGQKYGGDVLAKVGKGAAGVDLPIFQTMFGSMYDIEQDSPLWLTIPAAFTDEVANLYGLYNKSEGRFGLGKVKDFGKFVASSFVPRFLRSPIFIFPKWRLVGRFLQDSYIGHKIRTSIPRRLSSIGKLPTTSPSPPVLANGLTSGLTNRIFTLNANR